MQQSLLGRDKKEISWDKSSSTKAQLSRREERTWQLLRSTCLWASNSIVALMAKQHLHWDHLNLIKRIMPKKKSNLLVIGLAAGVRIKISRLLLSSKAHLEKRKLFLLKNRRALASGTSGSKRKITNPKQRK